MTPDVVCTLIHRRMDELDRLHALPEPDPVIVNGRAGEIVQEIAARLARLAKPGCADLFEASLDYGGKPDPPEAKVFLVRCLEVLSNAVPAAESKYLDCKKAAEYLGIAKSQVYDQVASGRLKPLRGPRNVYRFTTAMLDEYLHGK